jgi:serine/threonine protein kinase
MKSQGTKGVPTPDCSVVTVIATDAEFSQLFELGKELGAGAYGKVLRCREKKTGLEYAVKSIELKSLEKKHVAALWREVAVLAYLSEHHPHPNVCRMQSCYASPTTLWICLELLEGGDLFDAVHAGAFPEKRVAAAMIDIGAAVAHMHSLGIGHLDIKPEVCAASALKPRVTCANRVA